MTPDSPHHPDRTHPRADRPFDCDDVDGRLAEYLDGTADTPEGPDADADASGGDPTTSSGSTLSAVDCARIQTHLADCSRCEALVADLRSIATHAAALPPLRPSRDLWSGIAARIERTPRAPADHVRNSTDHAADLARVLPFRAPPRPADRVSPRSPRTHLWRLAAAAVLLVVASSGATFVAMTGIGGYTVAIASRSGNTPAAVATAERRASADPGAQRVGAEPSVSDSSTDDERGDNRSAVPERPHPEVHHFAQNLSVDHPSRASRRDRGASSADVPLRSARTDSDEQLQLQRATLAALDATVPGAADYDREIARLRAAVAERRGDLDSATVAVLARNLRVIDAAILASRAALARDPHSPFLGDQLTRALGQKVELLRTAALIPRT